MIALSYVELTVSDLAGAKAFYGSVFGWQFNDYGPGYAGIRRTDGGEAGGLALGQPAPGGPLVLLEIADDTATLEGCRSAIDAAGGRAGGIAEYPGGRRFEFTDPSGNRLGVFRSDHE